MLILDPPGTAGGTGRFQVRVMTFDARPRQIVKSHNGPYINFYRQWMIEALEADRLNLKGKQRGL